MRTKDDVDGTTGNRDGVDLRRSPSWRAIGIFQALQEQIEVGVTPRCKNCGDV